MRSSTLRLAVPLIFLSLVVKNLAQSDCKDYVECKECLENGCARSSGECMDDCFISDAICYKLPLNNFKPTSQQLCAMESNEKLDNDACFSNDISSCEDCTSTIWPSDPSKNCMWFESVQYCGTRCGIEGCGITDSSQCAAPVTVENVESYMSTPMCSDNKKCTECIDNDCSWTAGKCMEECFVADTYCYNTFYFEDMTALEICTEANPEPPSPVAALFNIILALLRPAYKIVAEDEIVSEFFVSPTDDEYE